MDLKTSGPLVSEEEKQLIDSIVDSAILLNSNDIVGIEDIVDPQIATRSDKGHRDLLLPVLHGLQEKIGYISRGAINYLSIRLGSPPAETYGIASFYALFSFEQSSPTTIHVCDDIACRTSQGKDPAQELEAILGEAEVDHGGITWKRSPCLGRCEEGSACFIQRSGQDSKQVLISPFRADQLLQIINQPSTQWLNSDSVKIPQIKSDPGSLRLLKRIGVVDPTSLESYRSAGGYQALAQGLEMGPENIIREIKDAKLVGRGGAAFPTAIKWQGVSQNPIRPHYFVCNADESEPGTFKDRIIIEQDPFSLIEGLTIASYATGCDKGYIYIRGEYPLGEKRLLDAIAQAHTKGYLGKDILGKGFDFDIEIRRGAGAYIAGEETALLNSIEGKRAEPRNKPPFPVQAGLFGKPTGINNVETLLNVVEILNIGGEAFSQIGTANSSGTRLFCLSGSITNPGLYEAEFGITLRELLELGGGIQKGKTLKTILLGGAAGSFVTPDQLDLPLSLEATRQSGTTLGSGVVMVFDSEINMSQILLRIAQFFQDESCGQCVPCRVGTVRQEELLSRLVQNKPFGTRSDELSLLSQLGTVMRDSSICGLGQTAANAIESAYKLNLVEN